MPGDELLFFFAISFEKKPKSGKDKLKSFVGAVGGAKSWVGAYVWVRFEELYVLGKKESATALLNSGSLFFLGIRDVLQICMGFLRIVAVGCRPVVIYFLLR